jgi:hypothetical protein
LPEGARPVSVQGPGPFVTRAVYEVGGAELVWSSRPHRKRLLAGRSRPALAWRTRSWWIAVLFMIGSACFALGAVPGYVSLVGLGADGATFFVGSIFFTSAATLQYVEVVNTPPAAGHPTATRFVSWEPGRIDWLATSIQLVGTVFFNISTFRAMLESIDDSSANLLSWRPDALGSLCFLVASWLAFAEAGHGWLSWRPDDLGWVISALNLAGSIFFGLSAIGAYVVSSTGELLNAALANSGTFIGAIGFLIGAALLIPEACRAAPADPAMLSETTRRTP